MVMDIVQHLVSTSSPMILKQEVIHSEEKPFTNTFLPVYDSSIFIKSSFMSTFVPKFNIYNAVDYSSKLFQL